MLPHPKAQLHPLTDLPTSVHHPHAIVISQYTLVVHDPVGLIKYSPSPSEFPVCLILLQSPFGIIARRSQTEAEVILSESER